MNFFKHYVNASESKSLNEIFDKFGHKGIAFYWMFVELCVEKWDGSSEPELFMHRRVIVSKFKSSWNSVQPWLELSSTLGLCEICVIKSEVRVKFPKLLEIKSSRGKTKNNKKILPPILDIDKEEEEDVDVKSKTTTPRQLITECSKEISDMVQKLPEIWNLEKLKANSPLAPSSGIGPGKYNDAIRLVEKLQTKEAVSQYFETIHSSPFHTGDNTKHWRATFNWALGGVSLSSYLGGRLSVDKADLDASNSLLKFYLEASK